jgi:hypothetical protein
MEGRSLLWVRFYDPRMQSKLVLCMAVMVAVLLSLSKHVQLSRIGKRTTTSSTSSNLSLSSAGPLLL